MKVIKKTKEVSIITTQPKEIKFLIPSFHIPVHYLQMGAIFLCLVALATLLTSVKSPEIKDVREIIEEPVAVEASISIVPTFESIDFNDLTDVNKTVERNRDELSLEIRKKSVELLKDWHPQDRVFYRGKTKVVVTRKEMMQFVPDFIVEEVINNVPSLAAITAAQTDIESCWFNSSLSMKTNNGYGIKWVSKWDKDPITWMKQYREGHQIAKDDSPTDKFIKFKSKWASIRFHTKFLTLLHYKKHIGKDFKGWARGLRTSKYATDKSYETNLNSKYKILDLVIVDSIAKELRKQFQNQK